MSARGFARAGCRAGTVLLLALAAGWPAGAQSRAAGVEKISPTVFEELAAAKDGWVSVLVVLEPVPLLPSWQQDEQKALAAMVEDAVLSRVSAAELRVTHRYRTIAGLAGRVTAAGLAELAADPDVAAVTADVKGSGLGDVSVPFIGADRTRNIGYTGVGITVAVLDTGIDTDHPDLSDDIAAGAYHFYHTDDTHAYSGPGAEDDQGHGTNVAGIITSRGVVAPVGVAPDTDILAVKVINSANKWWMSDLVAGIDYVTDHVFDYSYLCAINLSLGTYALHAQCPCDAVTDLAALKAVLDAARNVGIAIFAASGNDGSCTAMCAPACLSAATAVAAVYDQDLGPEPDSGTYHGEWSGFPYCADATTAPDKIVCISNRSGCNALAAPGRRITSCGKGGGTSEFTGTSQATPHCTGVAALMADYANRQMYFLTPDALVGHMLATGVPTDDICGTAPNPVRIDAVAALRALGLGLPCELDKLIASDAGMNQCFGGAVDTDGDVIVVGRESPPAAFVFRRQGTGWVEETKLTAGDAESYYFGYAVGVSGDWIVVGDPWYRFQGNASVGAAFVFRREGGAWVKKARLMASDWAGNDWFGTVAIDGSRIVVGAHLDDDACPANPNCDSGSAYVFDYNGVSWVQTAKLTAGDAAQGDRFGQAVAVSGDRVLVGAYCDDAPGADSGSAYVFVRTASWGQEQKLTAGDGAAGDQFGCKVALDGGVAVVGAHRDDHIGADAGSGYIFRNTGFGASPWIQEAKLTAADAAAGDRFGCAVSVSGERVLVGALQNDDAGAESGSAYVFENRGGGWWQKYKLLASDANPSDNYGAAVALQGDRAVLGARLEEFNRGSVYVCAVGGDCNGNARPDLCDIAEGSSADANGNAVPDECELHPGDLNCDGAVTFADIDPFVVALSGQAAYEALYPDCPWLNADCDGDGAVTFADIDAFVAILSGG